MIVPPVSWSSAMGPGGPCTDAAIAGRGRPKNETGDAQPRGGVPAGERQADHEEVEHGVPDLGRQS